MLAASLALAALAVLLAAPVPLVLAGAPWTRRAPALALVLWQAIALAGGLSMIGALLAAGLSPWGSQLAPAAVAFVRDVVDAEPVAAGRIPQLLALGGAVFLAGHLLLNLLLTVVARERERRRHLTLVRLLSSPLPDRPGAHVIDDPAPAAYCLPDGTASVTVLSAGIVRLLDEQELQAVLEHERAHLRQRHDVVLTVFRAWSISLPWFPIASRAEREVGTLIEMLADDRARQRVPDVVLARAIALVGGSRSGLESEEAAGPVGVDARAGTVQARVRRLLEPGAALSAVSRVAVAALSLALLAVPTVTLLVPLD